MLERHIQFIRTDDPGQEGAAETRLRLKDRFPAGAARRMTQLGMLVGALLNEVSPTAEDTLIYASHFGESRTLEGFLDSFPAASPTMFQTSIHPSGAQQALIGRQQPVREFMPLAGSTQLVTHALLAALTAPSPRVVLCGGEERGGTLLEVAAASDRSFAFAMLLTQARTPDTVGTLSVSGCPDAAQGLSVYDLFQLLHARRTFSGPVGAGIALELRWS